MEKLLIINEKPSQCAAFCKALTGQQNNHDGSYDGYEFHLTHLFGHILEMPVPEETAQISARNLVGKFSNTKNIPWRYDWFNFDSRRIRQASFANVIDDIRSYLEQGYLPVIASDIDDSGEGDLLVREVLDFVNYQGKTYREYHVDEAEKSIRKAMLKKNLKIVDHNDPKYRIARARTNMDFMTQQLTRIATKQFLDAGYVMPTHQVVINGREHTYSQVVPVGRLKSVILRTIGDQERAIKDYRPSTVYESRYQLDKLILSRDDLPRYQSKEEWTGDNLPKQSRVKEVKQERGATKPPKAYSLSQVAGEMAEYGVSASQTLKLFQAMYEAHYLSYPRSEDTFVSPEQFNDATAQLDRVLTLLQLPASEFTHREPRPGYVKEGSSHGALRYGEVLPNSLDELVNKFGNHADQLWTIVVKRFIQMYMEDVLWTKHYYETCDTPKPFTGTIRVLDRKPSVSFDDETSNDGELPDLTKLADLFPYPIKSKKPANPTAKWLYAQLKKDNVGTGATRVQTVSQMSGKNNETPLNDGKVLSLSPLGDAGYYIAKQTRIGSVEGTQYLQNLLQTVANNGSYDDAYQNFDQVIAQDVAAIRNTDLSKIEIDLNKRDYASGQWHGEDVRFNRIFAGHRFTDDEVDRLLNGEKFELNAQVNGNPMKLLVKLDHCEYKGINYIGVKAERPGYVSGTWQGKVVKIKGSYMDHTFTRDELNRLFNDETIEIEVHNKQGAASKIEGKLEDQIFEKDGKKYQFVGFKGQFPQKEGYRTAIWRGKEVKFKTSFSDHRFTEDEITQLLAGKEIEVEFTSASGRKMTVKGKFGTHTYKGYKVFGFKPQFEKFKK